MIKVTQVQMKVTRCTVADRLQQRPSHGKVLMQKNITVKLAPEIERL